MVITRNIFFLIIIIICCCASKATDKLIGNWSYCKDGTYFELYVNDSVIYEINDKVPLLTKEHYVLIDTIVHVLNEDKTVKKEIKITENKSGSLTFTYKNGGEVISFKLFKMNAIVNIPFYDKNNPEMIEVYENEFMERAKKFREKHSCNKKNEPQRFLDYGRNKTSMSVD